MAMTSSRPYLIRALREWIIANDCTPHILVNALAQDVLVPQDYVNPDGQVVLNISPSAVVDYRVDDQKLCFKARFGGVPTEIYVPHHAVMGIYARENKQGMMFEREPEPSPEGPKPSPSGKTSPSKNRPSLKVVK